ncbi:MAG: hypothetical protein COC03_07755 [Robiginitomaculum sp.]|nr:MAG: hypothetical protein COC03_07755 [Robiginitomaculum sp.]
MLKPSELPEPGKLKKVLQALAALDAILSPEWEYRYYSFNSRWGNGEQMGSIRNGAGDDVFFLFNGHGCFLKGFSHEYPQSQISSSDFYQSIPSSMATASKEPAFSPNSVSYCTWRSFNDYEWQSSVKENQLNNRIYFLLDGLMGQTASYQKFATDYYEADVDMGVVTDIFEFKPVSKAMAKTLNSDIIFTDLCIDLEEIGFPVMIC